MPITPYTPGKINPADDYDAAYDKLQTWLERVTVVYEKSPEYQALSRANKANGGGWFRFFMEMVLGYFDGKLANVDVDTAREIMEELTPRKMICSDTQAKTIVPELIAFWSFLLRECGAKKLKHAASVIAYLEGIKKNYLRIYNREDEKPLIPLDMVDQENPNFIPWVDWMIDQELDAYDKTDAYRLSEEWKDILSHPHGVAQLVQHICLNDCDLEDDDEAVEVVELILLHAFQNLFMQVRNKDAEALEVLESLEHNLVQADASGALDPHGARLVFQALVHHRAFLTKDFLNFIKQWRMEAVERDSTGPVPEMPSDEHIQQMILHALDEAPDEFAMVASMQQALGMLPSEGLSLVFHALVETDDTRIGDVLTLYVLDAEADIALAAIQALSSRPACVSPVSLNRLVRIRNWLTGPVQKVTDELIRNVRKKGVMPAAPEQGYEIQEAWMPPIDGVGSQGVMMLLRKGYDYRLAGCVFKEGAGVVDAFVSPPGMKKEMLEVINEARSQMGKMEKITQELVRILLPAFLAEHRHSSLPVDQELIQIMEILELDNWNPEPQNLINFIPAEFLAEADEEEIAKVQKSSSGWCTTTLGSSWFLMEDTVGEVLEGVDTSHCVQTVCDELLEHQRSRWQNRMVRMALWSHYGKNKKLKRHTREFLVVHQLLASSLPASDINLMHKIARSTVGKWLHENDDTAALLTF
ncbi:hypothetical protein [Parendozoicomonas sp. Alg238-R29]|uniref:hypothetical protein n=1 Tax=Parendozoicomonas sp. Alg238-R29 TaxID=2993446 RepID=UPI00248D6D7C|nr:hypothetical protein [Parendozoicomonas sp. Alg238-R29]